MANNGGMRGVDMAITLLLVIVVGASVLPSAFTDWYNYGNATNATDNWPSSVLAIWDLVPLFAILALAIYMYQKVDR